METLQAAYQAARRNNGAPGIDGVTFAAIEDSGRRQFLSAIRQDLLTHRYTPLPSRKAGIPKGHRIAQPSTTQGLRKSLRDP